jgi:hypothetical protein
MIEASRASGAWWHSCSSIVCNRFARTGFTVDFRAEVNALFALILWMGPARSDRSTAGQATAHNPLRRGGGAIEPGATPVRSNRGRSNLGRSK